MALTLRLSETEEQQLESIKQATGASTSSAALKNMIDRWMPVHKELSDYKKRYQNSQTRLQELESAIALKLDADRQLKKLLKK